MDLTKTDGTNRISQPVFLMAVGRKSDGCWQIFRTENQNRSKRVTCSSTSLRRGWRTPSQQPALAQQQQRSQQPAADKCSPPFKPPPPPLGVHRSASGHVQAHAVVLDVHHRPHNRCAMRLPSACRCPRSSFPGSSPRRTPSRSRTHRPQLQRAATSRQVATHRCAPGTIK